MCGANTHEISPQTRKQCCAVPVDPVVNDPTLLRVSWIKALVFAILVVQVEHDRTANSQTHKKRKKKKVTHRIRSTDYFTFEIILTKSRFQISSSSHASS
jgi:hypothetical protein